MTKKQRLDLIAERTNSKKLTAEYLNRAKEEGIENSVVTAATASAYQANILKDRYMRNFLKSNPAGYAKNFLGKTGGLALAVGAGVDAYQGRDLASSAFDTPTPNLGQRASGVAASIANGISFGTLGDPEVNARTTHSYFADMFN